MYALYAMYALFGCRFQSWHQGASRPCDRRIMTVFKAERCTIESVQAGKPYKHASHKITSVAYL